MSHIDEELKSAIEESARAARREPERGASVTPPVTSPRPVAPAAAESRGRGATRNLGLLLGSLALGAGVVALLLTNMTGSGAYSRNVEELLRDREAARSASPAELARLLGRTTNVQGTLVSGSLTRREEPCAYRFRLKKNAQELQVEYPQCAVPDTFRDMPGVDVEVTATGHLTESGEFQATQIMAKCPSKYETGKGEGGPGGPAALAQ